MDTKCQICDGHYNRKLRQFCPYCATSAPSLTRMVGKLFNRAYVEVVRGV